MQRPVPTLVQAVLTGRIDPAFTPEGDTSAIAKSPAEGPLTVNFLGIEGDEQADLRVHGGPDKAVHHYPRDHYPDWRMTLGAHPLLDAAGAFGENISTLGWTEEMMCIGDRLRLGSALVEVAQGRQPCWKQGHRLGSAKLLAAMVSTGRCGWYYRVIEEGSVAPGDTIALTSRVHPEWNVQRVFRLIIGGRHRGEGTALRELATMRELAAGWRKRAARLAE